MQINIGEFLTKRAMLSPDQEGLVCEGVRLTFSQMNERANRLAGAMKKLGVKRGDRVALLAFNEPEYYEVFFGLGKIGAVLVPLNYRLAGPELQYILEDSGARVFIMGADFHQVVDGFRKDIPAEKLISLGEQPPEWAESYQKLVAAESPDEPEIEGGDHDTISILYTSGTTGRPKGAMLTHLNYFWTSVTMQVTLREPGETALLALPLFHIGALGGVPYFIHRGARSVLLRTFDPKRFLELIQEEKVTGFGSVPVMLSFLKLVPDFEKYDFSSVKIILVYAAPVPVSLIEEYGKAGIEVRQLYGLTECTGPATVIDSENALSRAGSCGLPFFHTDVRLVDDKDQEVTGPDALGEVAIRSDNVMKGYWNRPEETAKTIRDGWLYTGDIARRDQQGFYYIFDRKKDMIISGGENIYPAELEDIILTHPQVADVAIIGFPHETWGEAVKAIVVPQQGQDLTEQQLVDWCKEKMGKFKIPKQVVFTDAIPRTPTGKILKRVLRDQYNQR
jgi:acyl-CoA synthetase (AMP-forming)/AMP-acid ligase II